LLAFHIQSLVRFSRTRQTGWCQQGNESTTFSEQSDRHPDPDQSRFEFQITFGWGNQSARDWVHLALMKVFLLLECAFTAACCPLMLFLRWWL